MHGSWETLGLAPILVAWKRGAVIMGMHART